MKCESDFGLECCQGTFKRLSMCHQQVIESSQLGCDPVCCPDSYQHQSRDDAGVGRLGIWATTSGLPEKQKCHMLPQGELEGDRACKVHGTSPSATRDVKRTGTLLSGKATPAAREPARKRGPARVSLARAADMYIYIYIYIYIHPEAAARLESAIMSLGDVGVRSPPLKGLRLRVKGLGFRV